MTNILPRDVNQERQARIIELTRQGLSARDIANIVGSSPRTVTRVRSREGIAQAGAAHPLTPDELQAAAALLADGCPYAEVARTVGRSHRAIAKYFPGHGWTRTECGRFSMSIRWGMVS